MLAITTNFNSHVQFPANSNSISGFGTFDYSALVSASRTNDPATLQLLFPGVIVATSSNYLTVVATPIITSHFENIIGSPIGSAPKLVIVTNGYTYSGQTIYVTTFANVITNHYRANPTAILQTITVAPKNGAPLGSPSFTNISTKTVTLTNMPAGDYYFLPPDQCPVNLLGVLYTNVVVTTNFLTVVNTNIVTATNTTTFAFSQSLVTSFTNYVYDTHPVDCVQVAGATSSYQGIENIKFVRVPDGDLDPLTGNFIQPITNNYTMVRLNPTNSKPELQIFQRVVTQPDVLLTAQDLAGGPADVPVVPYAARTVPLYNQNNVLTGLAGPGTIDPTTVITYDKVGDVFGNGSLAFNLLTTNSFLSEFTHIPLLAWASFDGSTNDPVVYPNGTSIENLESQIFVQITPTSVPNGTNGVAYAATTFTASGGAFSPPFTWSQTGLPAGLSLSSGGTLSGTPAQSGTFDFTVQLTDSLSRSVQWSYPIIIQ